MWKYKTCLQYFPSQELREALRVHTTSVCFKALLVSWAQWSHLKNLESHSVNQSRTELTTLLSWWKLKRDVWVFCVSELLKSIKSYVSIIYENYESSTRQTVLLERHYFVRKAAVNDLCYIDLFALYTIVIKACHSPISSRTQWIRSLLDVLIHYHGESRFIANYATPSDTKMTMVSDA